MPTDNNTSLPKSNIDLNQIYNDNDNYSNDFNNWSKINWLLIITIISRKND